MDRDYDFNCLSRMYNILRHFYPLQNPMYNEKTFVQEMNTIPFVSLLYDIDLNKFCENPFIVDLNNYLKEFLKPELIINKEGIGIGVYKPNQKHLSSKSLCELVAKSVFIFENKSVDIPEKCSKVVKDYYGKGQDMAVFYFINNKYDGFNDATIKQKYNFLNYITLLTCCVSIYCYPNFSDELKVENLYNITCSLKYKYDTQNYKRGVMSFYNIDKSTATRLAIAHKSKDEISGIFDYYVHLDSFNITRDLRYYIKELNIDFNWFADNLDKKILNLIIKDVNEVELLNKEKVLESFERNIANILFYYILQSNPKFEIEVFSNNLHLLFMLLSDNKDIYDIEIKDKNVLIKIRG